MPGLRAGRPAVSRAAPTSGTRLSATPPVLHGDLARDARRLTVTAVRLLRPLATSASGGISTAYGSVAPPAVFWTSHLARSLAELGEFSAARAAAATPCESRPPLHHPFLTVHVSCSMATVALRQAGPTKRSPSSRSRARSRAGVLWSSSRSTSGSCLRVRPRRPPRGGRSASHGAADRRRPLHLLLPVLADAAREGYLLLGEVQDALTRADRALELSRKRGERGNEGWSLRLIGDALSVLRPDSEPEIADSYRSRWRSPKSSGWNRCAPLPSGPRAPGEARVSACRGGAPPRNRPAVARGDGDDTLAGRAPGEAS